MIVTGEPAGGMAHLGSSSRQPWGWGRLHRTGALQATPEPDRRVVQGGRSLVAAERHGDAAVAGQRHGVGERDTAGGRFRSGSRRAGYGRRSAPPSSPASGRYVAGRSTRTYHATAHPARCEDGRQPSPRWNRAFTVGGPAGCGQTRDGAAALLKEAHGLPGRRKDLIHGCFEDILVVRRQVVEKRHQ